MTLCGAGPRDAAGGRRTAVRATRSRLRSPGAGAGLHAPSGRRGCGVDYRHAGSGRARPGKRAHGGSGASTDGAERPGGRALGPEKTWPRTPRPPNPRAKVSASSTHTIVAGMTSIAADAPYTLRPQTRAKLIAKMLPTPPIGCRGDRRGSARPGIRSSRSR